VRFPVFALLRVGVALTSVISLLLLSLVIFARDAASTARQGAQVLGYVVKLFTSAFTEGTAPTGEPWRLGGLHIAIGVLSVAMFISAFAPGARWFLHTLATADAVLLLYYAGRSMLTGVTMEVVCVPFLAAWFVYYATCLMRTGNPA
jgi:hypothetical protein